MTRFRPCIDLHHGKVKQIVGGTLKDTGSGPHENFVSDYPSSYYAEIFCRDGVTGGHVIQLGSGNEAAALSALKSYPQGLQLGGGVNPSNAAKWIEAGASHVIVTSALFDHEGRFLPKVLEALVAEVGKEHVVIDLSCRRFEDQWRVAMNRWQTLTEMEISHETLDFLLPYTDEFLIHAADVEGLCGGMDIELIRELGSWGKCAITYAGGASSLNDFQHVHDASYGNVDLTIGSALDIFGGKGVLYEEAICWKALN